MNDLVKVGLINNPPLIQLCMEVGYGAPDNLTNLMSMVHVLPPRAVYSALSIGPIQLLYAASVGLAGADVRVGLEDNLYARSRAAGDQRRGSCGRGNSPADGGRVISLHQVCEGLKAKVLSVRSRLMLRLRVLTSRLKGCHNGRRGELPALGIYLLAVSKEVDGFIRTGCRNRSRARCCGWSTTMWPRDRRRVRCSCALCPALPWLLGEMLVCSEHELRHVDPYVDSDHHGSGFTAGAHLTHVLKSVPPPYPGAQASPTKNAHISFTWSRAWVTSDHWPPASRKLFRRLFGN